MSKQIIQSSSDSDAKIAGGQEDLSGELVAVYNITAEEHPSLGSTVTEKVLHDLNLPIPGEPHS